MDRSNPLRLPDPIYINDIRITHVVIGRHYLEKHSAYMSDEIIFQLVNSLNGRKFKPESTSKGIEYYAADIEIMDETSKKKLFRIVWLFEGNFFEIIGVINAYRVKKKRK